MLYITARPGDRLNLGHEGENLARTIRFDISKWQALYGEGIVSLLHQRAGDAAPYPCAITVDGAIVEWAITNADTAKPSQYGKYELQYRFGDGLSKTCTGVTCVFDALGEPTKEPPEAAQGWLDNILAAGYVAEAERIKAEQAKADAEKSAGEAGLSAAGAKKSEDAAADSEKNAKASENAAKLAEGNAKKSETAAAQSATNAKASEDAATKSAEEAKKSEDDLQAAVDAAALSARNAATYESGAKQSQNAAEQNAYDALVAANAAKKSETASSLSEQNAKQSETAAQLAATDAEKSAQKAKDAVKSAVKSVNGKTPDEDGNVEIDSVASWNDLADKPFGEEVDVVEVFPRTGLTLEEGMYPPTAKITAALGLVAGEKYIVTYQGVDYACVAQDYATEGSTFVTLGDLGKMTGGISTGEPFLVMEFPPDYAAQVGANGAVTPFDGSNAFTIEIKQFKETIHTIDPKYLPEALQFGEETVQKEYLPETTLTFSGPMDDTKGLAYGTPLVEGKVYRVVWDGTTYECTAIAGTLNGLTIIGIGNEAALGGANTGEPFGIGYVVETGYLSIIPITDGTSHTFSVSYEAAEVRTIDQKYLPEALQFGDETTTGPLEITWDGNADGKTVVNLSYDEEYDCYNQLVKVSDILPTVEELRAGIVGTPFGLSWDVDSDEVTIMGPTAETPAVAIIANGLPFVVVAYESGVAYSGVTIPEAGIYFFAYIDGYTSLLALPSVDHTTVKTIDPKYIKLGSGLTVDENGAISLALTNVAEVGA